MFQRVFLSPDMGVTEVVRGFLLTAGYHPLEVNAGGHVTHFGADQAFYVEVPREEVEGARVFLTENGYGAHIL